MNYHTSISYDTELDERVESILNDVNVGRRDAIRKVAHWMECADWEDVVELLSLVDYNSASVVERLLITKMHEAAEEVAYEDIRMMYGPASISCTNVKGN